MIRIAGQTGSSPRVRGKLGARHRRRLGAGFIPACAGKTMTTQILGPATRVHPRVCGENGVLGQCIGREPWFIPACAGKTTTPDTGSSCAAVHPRVCGENLADNVVIVDGRGSSPRVRGKHLAARTRRHQFGFIPACAGKTRSRPTTWAASAVHPRVCGENTFCRNIVGMEVGSSPRVRGKLVEAFGAPWSEGFIPACAGKTGWCTFTKPARTVHPRVCGENGVVGLPRRVSPGSSPRVRGKPHQALPARKPRLVHPRVCGENCEV